MSLSGPYKDGFIAVPSNTDFRQGIGDGMFILATGDIEFMTMGGTIIGPVAVTEGMLIPFRVKQIRTGTTATVAVGMLT